MGEATVDVPIRNQRVPALSLSFWFGRTLWPFWTGCKCLLWEEVTVTAGCH